MSSTYITSYRLNLIILLVVTSIKLMGQNQYFIDTLYPVHDLDPHLEILPDPEHIYDIEQVRSDSTLEYTSLDSLIVYTSRGTPLLDFNSAYWGKIQLSTNGNLEDWIMLFEHIIIENNAWLKGVGKVDVYTFIDDQLHFHKKSGTSYLPHEKEINNYWNQNEIYLDIPQGKIVDTYIRIEGSKSGITPSFNVSVRKPGYTSYYPYATITEFLNTFMLGVSFIIFVYHFLRFLYTRQRLYLLFSVWVLLCTLIFSMVVSFSSEFLLKYFPGARLTLWTAISTSIFFSYWFFGLKYVNTKEKYPILDKLIKIYLIVVIIESTIMTIFAATGYQVAHASVGNHFIYISLFSFIGLFLTISLILKKDTYARYFGIAASIGKLGFIIGGLWAASIIRFEVDPFAVTFLLQMIAFSFAMAYRHQQISLASQQQVLAAQKSKIETARMKDLDEMKTKFFANISHEFRTPLSLITGPLDLAHKNSTAAGERGDHILLSNKSYNVIQKNTKRLQSLIDQLLELSKLESGHVHLNLVQGGIIKFLKSIVYSFESLAERKNINLNTSFPKDMEQAYYDKDKLEKIVVNFLSNSFKYTSNGGSVSFSFHPNGENFVIEISDTGKGINQKELPRIFDRFYRVEGTEEKGSGIGLALAKELIDLHRGQVNVDSTVGEGTTFRIRIPYTLKSLPEEISIVAGNMPTKPQDELSSVPSFVDEASEIKSSKASADHSMVLIVEDNEDLRNYIEEVLSDKYQVITASDGMQGERMAIEHIPDLIVSDIMMPKKDGYEMCHDLKSNQKTSHIPIIMLTAKAGQHNKMEGLTQGADAYLTKPFDSDELLVRVFNLIESRKKLWKHFTDSGLSISSDLPMDSIDDQFINSVIKAIKDNLDNEHFSVEDLGRSVGFSRSQLHRKLKALIDKSANQLIVEIRLNEARRMLENRVGTVSEIAFSVGYSSLPYFTRSFKKQFGVLPSKV